MDPPIRLCSLLIPAALLALIPGTALATPPLPPATTEFPAPGVQESEPDPSLAQTRPLRVFLLTMDQGDEVWERFGHNAILIRDEATGEEIAWNWGLFNFDDVDFIPRFLKGTMEYSMGGIEADWMIQQYAASNRSIYSNELLLTLEQARELDAFVRWNAQPENRSYIYDYFRDNCSTRLRDALDRVLDGRLAEHFRDRMTPRSWRWHARRLVGPTLWVDQGLSFLLGTRGDRPISEWEAMYVPMVLMEHLEEFRIETAPGESRPLLGPRQVIFEADRPATPDAPPPFSAWFPLLGIAGAGALVLLGVRVAGRFSAARVERAILGLAVAGWGLFAGALGLILVLVWFTDHVFIHRNLNLLYLSPLGPLLAVLAVLALWSPKRASGRSGRWAAVLALVVALGSVVAVLLQATGVVVQGNAEVVAVGLPVNLGVAVALMRVHRGAREARGLRPAT